MSPFSISKPIPSIQSGQEKNNNNKYMAGISIVTTGNAGALSVIPEERLKVISAMYENNIAAVKAGGK